MKRVRNDPGRNRGVCVPQIVPRNDTRGTAERFRRKPLMRNSFQTWRVERCLGTGRGGFSLPFPTVPFRQFPRGGTRNDRANELHPAAKMLAAKWQAWLRLARPMMEG